LFGLFVLFAASAFGLIASLGFVIEVVTLPSVAASVKYRALVFGLKRRLAEFHHAASHVIAMRAFIAFATLVIMASE
jgi:hypothetical protein